MIRRNFLKAIGAAITGWFGVRKVAKAEEKQPIAHFGGVTTKFSSVTLGEGVDYALVDEVERRDPKEELRQHLIDAFTEAVDAALAMPHHAFSVNRPAIPGTRSILTETWETCEPGWPITFTLNAAETPLPEVYEIRPQITTGVTTINECRAERGLPPYPKGGNLLSGDIIPFPRDENGEYYLP